MSVLGPGSFPAIGLAGSAAASQQRPAELADRDKADQALQKLAADELRLSNRDLDDSIETDFSHGQVSDRDPDGRLPWQPPGPRAQAQEDESAPQRAPAEPRPEDAEGERGRSLDVDV